MINHFLTEQADRLDVLGVPDKKSRLLPVGGKRLFYMSAFLYFHFLFFMVSSFLFICVRVHTPTINAGVVNYEGEVIEKV